MDIITALNSTFTRDTIPDGWRKADIFRPLDRIVQLIPVENIIYFVEWGILRIKFDCLSDIPEDAIIVDKVANYTSLRSHTICMMCGKKSIKRRRESTKPRLCELHYIIYLNQLDGNNLDLTDDDLNKVDLNKRKKKTFINRII